MKHTTTLVLSEPLPAAGMRVLEARPGVRLRVLAAPSEGELASALPEADGVVLVMERPPLTAASIALAVRLRIACRMGAGYDHIDVAALTRRGIPLATTGAANAGTVAEHALYLMLALAKRGPALERAVKAGAWPRAFGNVELQGRTCLIIGYGRIGRAVAQRAGAFGMKLLYCDPAVPGAQAPETALPQADFVVLACPLTPATRHLIGAPALSRMKRTAFLVNVARGAVVDQAALVAALEARRIAGAGLDVLEEEPPPRDHALLGRDDVVLSPHVAAYVATAYDRMAAACAQAALDGLDGKLDAASVVNPQVLQR